MNSLLLTLNLQEDTILLNQGVLDVLGHPRQVQILINEEIGSLLLRACTIDDLQAVVVPEEHVMQFEIGGRSLLKKIRRKSMTNHVYETVNTSRCIRRSALT